MEQEVKKDILDILSRAVEILRVREEKDVLELRELSDHTIHDASIYQDIDAVQIATLMYALYKVLERKMVLSDRQYQKLYSTLQNAHEMMGRGRFKEYNRHIQEAFAIITDVDQKASQFMQEVIEKAKITKGSKLFHHGLSTKRAAEMMGVSEWQLLGYIGKTREYEETPRSVSVKKRLQYAFEVFG
jgi:hypothetical protein